VEPEESSTAALADSWISIAPGDGAAAAREIVSRLPADGTTLILAADESPAILNWNAELNSLGHTVVERTEAPVPASWTRQAAPVEFIQHVPDGSLGALLIDESAPDLAVPWEAIAPKLTRDAVVVTFGSSPDGFARHADFALPTAVYPEVTTDIPPAIDSPAAVFRLATPLDDAPAGMADPPAFLARLAGMDPGDPLRERAAAIHRSGRGSLFTYGDRQARPLKDVKAGEFWTALVAGACWTDSPLPAKPPRWDRNAAAPAIAPAVRPQPPLFTKLYQESGLKGVAL
jgi:hypothetical protein